MEGSRAITVKKDIRGFQGSGLKNKGSGAPMLPSLWPPQFNKGLVAGEEESSFGDSDRPWRGMGLGGGWEGQAEQQGKQHPRGRNGAGRCPVDPGFCSGKGPLRGSQGTAATLLPGAP